MNMDKRIKVTERIIIYMLLAVLAIGLIIGAYFLFQVVLLKLNAKAISSDYPVIDYRINYKNYEEFDDFGLSWTMDEPTSRIKDNNFTEDYLVCGENYDLISCTDNRLYIRKGLNTLDSPLLENVASVVVGENVFCKVGFIADLNLDSNECYDLMELIIDDKIGYDFEFNNEYEILHSNYRDENKDRWYIPLQWYLTFRYNDTSEMSFEGLTYSFEGPFYFAKGNNDEIFIICHNTKAKKLPTNIAKKIMQELFDQS